MEVNKICVMGAGIMGHGIAQVCATSGYLVSLCDVDESISKRALENIISRNKSYPEPDRMDDRLGDCCEKSGFGD